MEFRRLLYFLAVAEELHFGRAAERLHVAQPAVSDQIRKLETDLGTALFCRTPREVRLTPAGMALVPEARRLLRQVDLARDAVRRSHGDGKQPRLRLGHTALGFPTSLLRALRPLRDELGVESQLVLGDARSLLEEVRHDMLDAAIVHLPVAGRGLQAISLLLSELVAVAPNDHQHADPLPIAQLAGLPLARLQRRIDPAVHDTLTGALARHGVAVEHSGLELGTVEEVILAVESGSAIGVLPGYSIARRNDDGVVIHPIEPALPVISLALVVREETPAPPLSNLLQRITSESNPASWNTAPSPLVGTSSARTRSGMAKQ